MAELLFAGRLTRNAMPKALRQPCHTSIPPDMVIADRIGAARGRNFG
jgi:hypothetical protein